MNTYDQNRNQNIPDRTMVTVTGQEVAKVVSCTPSGSGVLPASSVQVPLFGMNRLKIWFSASGKDIPVGSSLVIKLYRDDRLPVEDNYPQGRNRRSPIGNPAGYPIAVPAVPAGTTIGLDFVDPDRLMQGSTVVEISMATAITMEEGGSGSITAGLFYVPTSAVPKQFETVGSVAAGVVEDTTYHYYIDLRDVAQLGLQLILTPGATGAFEVTVDGTLNSDSGPEDFDESWWQDITGDLFSEIVVDPPVISESSIMADDAGISRTLAYLRVNVTVATSDASTAFDIRSVKS